MSRRAAGWAALPLALGIAASTSFPPATARDTPPPTVGAAILTRDAVLRTGPSKSATRLGTVEEGEVVYLLPHGHRAGFLRVLTRDEEVGWITDRYAHAVDEDVVHVPSPPSAEPPKDDAPAPAASPPPRIAVAAGDFNGCPPQGTPSPRGTRFQAMLELNRLKNRSATPADADVDRAITLAGLLRRGDDAGRWNEARAADVIAYVYHVKPGGPTETVNCALPGAENQDTHIELTPGPTDTDPTRRVVVEVTPRWRAAMAAAGVDWSTRGIRRDYEGRWVRVRGWMFWDGEHPHNAENTNPGGSRIWRATAWEIHPVTSMTVVARP